MTDLRTLLTELGVPFKEHGESPLVSAGWVGISCPYCGIGTTKHGFGIHLRTLRTSCWKCSGRPLVSALCEITGQSHGDIKRRLGGVDDDPRDARVVRPTGRYREPAGVGPLLPVHRRYLQRRGFDPDEIAVVWGVGGIGLAPKLQFRLFLPVVVGGKAVSWTTRAVGNVELRYISADPADESVPLKTTLYGADLARAAAVVVEGPTDAWRIGPGAVATFGLSHTPAQVAAVAQFPVRCICFDNEATAQRRARKLADDLTPFPGETYVVTLSGGDPDSSPPAELDELRERFLV